MSGWRICVANCAWLDFFVKQLKYYEMNFPDCHGAKMILKGAAMEGKWAKWLTVVAGV